MIQRVVHSTLQGSDKFPLASARHGETKSQKKGILDMAFGRPGRSRLDVALLQPDIRGVSHLKKVRMEFA